ncbi:hypothetical protein C0J52_01580 [Blattella germanica]|nr:hypothetical protein C0J52_01580 [Blattella germanica]
MDPFTQRLLARAKSRREESSNLNINTNTGKEGTQLRNPLQDQKQRQLVKVTTEVELTLSKPIKEVSSVVTTKSGPFDKTYVSEEVAKENIEINLSDPPIDSSNVIRDSARSRLRRLGALYAVELTLSKPIKEVSSVVTTKSGPFDKTYVSEEVAKENIEINLSDPPIDSSNVIRDNSQISSPIHQTEGSFSAEHDDKDEVTKPQLYKSEKTGTRRLAKLAVLADTIKHWEDDLSHPSTATARDISNPDKSPAHRDEDNYADLEDLSAEETNLSPLVNEPEDAVQDQAKPKQVVWDQSIITALEAQGFSRTQSKSRLVYDYSKHSSQGDGRDPAAANKLGTITENTVPANHKSEKLEAVKKTGIENFGNLRSISSSRLQMPNSPEKRLPVKSNGSPRTVGVPQMGLRVGSPHRGDASPKTGSVLHKAAIFESNSPTKKNGKDPTELSVSERFALFERNKGQALIPKAAFSMPVPVKYLEGKDGDKSSLNKASSPGKANKIVSNIVTQLQKGVDEKPKRDIPARNSPSKTVGKAVKNPMNQLNKGNVNSGPVAPTYDDDVPASSSKALAQMFERGNVITADKSIIKNVKSERQKEIEMLLNRWNKNKEFSSSGGNGDSNEECEEKAVRSEAHRQANLQQPMRSPPVPPPLPADSPQAPAKFAANTFVSPKIPTNVSPLKSQSSASPEKKHKVSNLEQQYAGLREVKRVKVSPPKPGRLYPCLSDIEATTETESEMQDDYNASISDDMDSSGGNIGDTSFGREILQAAGIRESAINARKEPQQVQADSSDSDNESAVLEEIDDFLDEALGDDSDSENSPSPPKRTKDASHSPQRGYANEGRKQPYSSPTTAQSHSFKYTKGPFATEMENSNRHNNAEHIPSYVVEGKEEVPLMHTVSFYRRQQNLAMKGTPVRQIVRYPDINEDKIQPTASRSNEEDVSGKIAELVDEVSRQQTVISQASQALNLCGATVEFSGSAEEVEGEKLLLVATHRRQAALHEIQRLKVEGSLKPGGSSSELTERGSLIISNITLPLKKEYLRALAGAEQCHHFVCLVRAQEQVVATPVLEASSENLRKGGGASLVFPGKLKLDGLYSDFKATLEIYNLQTQREIIPHEIKYHIAGKKDGNTSKIRLTPKKLKSESRLVMPTVHSPAGPSAVRSPAFQMSGYVVFSLREVKRTQFTLNKVPIGQIDLNTCTTDSVGLVSRDICARPNTFLLETTRPSRPDDEESLVLILRGSHTTERHLLSADTKEDRVAWCTSLNKALAMLRVWGNKASRP